MGREPWMDWEDEYDRRRDEAGRKPLWLRLLVWCGMGLAFWGGLIAIAIWIWGVVAAFRQG